MVETYRTWFASWRRWHVLLLVTGSLAATAGMAVLADDGAWVLLPLLGLGVLAFLTPLGHPPPSHWSLNERRAPTPAQRDAKRRRKHGTDGA